MEHLNHSANRVGWAQDVKSCGNGWARLNHCGDRRRPQEVGGYRSQGWGVHRGGSDDVAVGTVVVAQTGGGVAVVGVQEVVKLEYTSRWGRAYEGLQSRWYTMWSPSRHRPHFCRCGNILCGSRRGTCYIVGTPCCTIPLTLKLTKNRSRGR